MNRSVLVITGFHRSATSATANYLSNSGLDMGCDLMPGNISNAKGHFEDWPAVHLHDQQLSLVKTTWQFHDEVALDDSGSHFLLDYVDARSQQAQYWGVKDPRACLFLQEWNEALGGEGAFLLVTRHWSSCIESLLNRHSRDLAHSLKNLEADSVGFNFWTKPYLAARMWLSYSRRLLAFARKHPEKVLLCTQRSLFEGAPLIDSINRRFGFELDATTVSPFEVGLLNDKASQPVKDSLSHSLIVELEDTWHALLSIADFKSSDEEPIYYPQPQISNDFQQQYIEQVQLNSTVTNGKKLGCDYAELSLQLDELLDPTLSKDELLALFKKIQASQLPFEDADKLNQFVSQYFPVAPVIWIELGRLFQNKGIFDSAVNVYQHAIALGNTPPYVNMLMAQCYQAEQRSVQALYFFDKALQLNPSNPVFYVQKAKYHSGNREFDLAEKCLLLGAERLGFVTPIVLELTQLLQRSDRMHEALSLLAKADTSNQSVQRAKSNLTLQLDYKQGAEDYQQMIAKSLDGKDKMRWLIDATKHISSAAVEHDFVTRCYAHWEKLV